MSRGIVLFAQSNEYLEQAYLCALSIKTYSSIHVCVVTSDDVPEEYKLVFDYIVDVPWCNETNIDSRYAVEHRWKLYHASPFDETLVLDTDMLILQDISEWFDFFKNYEIYFPSNVLTYRNEIVEGTYYRKAFVENDLPNLYFGMHYFSKGDFAHNFYKWLELVSANWELFYSEYCKKRYPKQASMDISCAIVAKILDCESKITNKISIHPTFVHMKSRVQNWKEQVPNNWMDRVDAYLTDDLNLYVGNHKQPGIFHYTENSFVTQDIINKFKEKINDSN